MGWLSRLLRLFRRTAPSRPAAAPASESDHTLVITIRLEGGAWNCQDGLERLLAIEDQLRDALAAAHAGHVEGHTIGPDVFDIFCIGPDAERLWQVAAPVLEPHPFPRGSAATRRFGPLGSGREEHTDLHWDG